MTWWHVFKNTEPIKKAIVDGYKRGICTKDGGYITPVVYKEPKYEHGFGKGSYLGGGKFRLVNGVWIKVA